MGALGRERLPTPTGLARIGITEFKGATDHVLLKIQLHTGEIDGTFGINNHFDAILFNHGIILADLFIEIGRIAEPGTTPPPSPQDEVPLR